MITVRPRLKLDQSVIWTHCSAELHGMKACRLPPCVQTYVHGQTAYTLHVASESCTAAAIHYAYVHTIICSSGLQPEFCLRDADAAEILGPGGSIVAEVSCEVIIAIAPRRECCTVDDDSASWHGMHSR